MIRACQGETHLSLHLEERRKTASKFWESRQITGGKTAGATRVFHGVSRAGGPSQQTTKDDGLSYRHHLGRCRNVGSANSH